MSDSSSLTRLSVRIYAGAAKNEVVAFADGVLRVKVAAPPSKGKANKELIDFLSKCLGISKNRLDIIKGQTSRNKIVAIEGLSQEESLKRLLPG